MKAIEKLKSLIKRSDKKPLVEVLEEMFEKEDALARQGFKPWRANPPNRGEIILAHRIEWSEPITIDTKKMSGMMNVNGLWWKPAKHQSAQILRLVKS